MLTAADYQPVPVGFAGIWTAVATACVAREPRKPPPRPKLCAELAKAVETEREFHSKLVEAERTASNRAAERVVTLTQHYWSKIRRGYTHLAQIDASEVKRAETLRIQQSFLERSLKLTTELVAADADRLEAGEQLVSSLQLLDTDGGRRPLRPYQVSALTWLVNRYERGLNGILADEMGLGKTVQTIALLCWFAEHKADWGPHIIVVPTAVVVNWCHEFRRWAPGLKVIQYIGSPAVRKKLREGWTVEGSFDVLVTSFNTFVNDKSVMQRRTWGFLVVDEAHHLKNFASQKYQAMIDLNAEYRLLLTGTPLQTSVMELWSLFHFVMPSAATFADDAAFREWFSNPLNEMVEGRSALNEEIVGKLHTLLRPFMLRRLKSEVARDLPTKREVVVHCRLSRRQRAIYRNYMDLAETRTTLAEGTFHGVVAVLLGLRKVCNHPDLFEDRPIMSALVIQHAIELLLPRQCLLLANADCMAEGFYNARTLREGMRTSRWPFGDLPFGLGTVVSDPPPPTLAAALTSPETLVAHLRSHAEEPDEPDWGIGSLAAFRDAAIEHRRRETNRRVHRLGEGQRFAIAGAEASGGASALCAISHHAVFSSMHRNPAYKAPPPFCPTLQERLDAVLPTLERVVCVHDAAVPVRPPRIATLHPVADGAPFRSHGDADWAARRHPGAAAVAVRDVVRDPMVRTLHPIRTFRSFAFPDPRLIVHDCGKLQILLPLLKRLRGEGHRCVIFTQFSGMLTILERFLALYALSYLRFDGSTRPELRQAYVERFNADPRVFCMLLSTRAGGIGLNLVGADTVIFYDSDWNPAMDLQAQDRCHRIGQTRPVTIYRLVTAGTVEAAILRKARERKKLNNIVIRGGGFAKQGAESAMGRRQLLRFLTDLDEDHIPATSSDDDSSGDDNEASDGNDGDDEDAWGNAVAAVEDAEDRDAAVAAESERKAAERDDADAAPQAGARRRREADGPSSTAELRWRAGITKGWAVERGPAHEDSLRRHAPDPVMRWAVRAFDSTHPSSARTIDEEARRSAMESIQKPAK